MRAIPVQHSDILTYLIGILIEDAKRRAELALFGTQSLLVISIVANMRVVVFSKAFDILLPMNFGTKFYKADTWLFTLSLSVLIVRSRQGKVKGFFGGMLSSVF